MSVAFVVQVVVTFVLKVVNDAAPGLVAAEVVGTPEICLEAGVLVPVFGIGAGRGGVEAGLATIDGIVGLPHLRGGSHRFAGDMVAAQCFEQLRPLFIVRKMPTGRANASHGVN